MMENFSYVHRVYESVDDNSLLSSSISKIGQKNEFEHKWAKATRHVMRVIFMCYLFSKMVIFRLEAARET